MESSNAKRGLAVVTGASTGIGYELARCAATAGYDLIIAADEPEIHTAAKNLIEIGIDVEAFEVDLSTQQGIQRFSQALKGLDRPVDLLLANVGRGIGMASSTKTCATSSASWRQTSAARSPWCTMSAIACDREGRGASC